MSWLKLVPPWAYAAVAALLIGALAGWTVQGWRLSGDVADAQRELASYRAQQQTARADAVTLQQNERLALEQRLAQLDTQSTQELTRAQNENERLRDLYSSADDERRRLRIEVRVARADAVVSAATAAGSMGDAASVELSDGAGRAVWNIRRAMIDDQAKLRYLQEWARSVTGK